VTRLRASHVELGKATTTVAQLVAHRFHYCTHLANAAAALGLLECADIALEVPDELTDGTQEGAVYGRRSCRGEDGAGVPETLPMAVAKDMGWLARLLPRLNGVKLTTPLRERLPQLTFGQRDFLIASSWDRFCPDRADLPTLHTHIKGIYIVEERLNLDLQCEAAPLLCVPSPHRRAQEGAWTHYKV
jgi:hypothetical protein